MSARQILDIDDDELITEELLKRKYRIQALKFHPDKNKSPDACERFQEIHKAFETLSQPTPVKSYIDILADFLKSANEETELIRRILNMVDTRSLETIRDLMTDVILQEINEFLKNHVKKKHELDTECIVLKPSLSDLLADNVFKLSIENRQFLIPLWYDELVYDISGAELIVKCCPELPTNIVIDAHNNLIVSVSFVASDIIRKDTIEIPLCNRTITINPSELKLVPVQTVILKNAGISRINRRDIYNVSGRTDIIVRIELL
jgi:hypothetical protein